jgi:hypothetical protein
MMDPAMKVANINIDGLPIIFESDNYSYSVYIIQHTVYFEGTHLFAFLSEKKKSHYWSEIQRTTKKNKYVKVEKIYSIIPFYKVTLSVLNYPSTVIFLYLKGHLFEGTIQRIRDLLPKQIEQLKVSANYDVLMNVDQLMLETQPVMVNHLQNDLGPFFEFSTGVSLLRMDKKLSKALRAIQFGKYYAFVPDRLHIFLNELQKFLRREVLEVFLYFNTKGTADLGAGSYLILNITDSKQYKEFLTRDAVIYPDGYITTPHFTLPFIWPEV